MAQCRWAQQLTLQSADTKKQACMHTAPLIMSGSLTHLTLTTVLKDKENPYVLVNPFCSVIPKLSTTWLVTWRLTRMTSAQSSKYALTPSLHQTRPKILHLSETVKLHPMCLPDSKAQKTLLLFWPHLLLNSTSLSKFFSSQTYPRWLLTSREKSCRSLPSALSSFPSFLRQWIKMETVLSTLTTSDGGSLTTDSKFQKKRLNLW